MGTLLDGRFWSGKRMMRWLNTSQEVCPAFSPVTFTWDNEAGQPSPWVQGTTLLEGGRLAWPSGGGSMSETGHALTLYAINGPFDVQPQTYGQCSIDYPLPLRYDPESFPIPIDPEIPSVFEPGTWEDYLAAYPGDIEGPPLLGLFPFGDTSQGVYDAGQVWQPASFLPSQTITLWTVIFWLPNPDGSNTEDLALVVPAGGVGAIPYGGALSAAWDAEIEPDTPEEILETPTETLVIEQQGLYRLEFSGTVQIESPGVAATLNLQVTYGDGWGSLAGLAGTPMGPLSNWPGLIFPVPGATQTILGGGRQLPKITATPNNDFSLVAGSTAVTGNLGTFDLTFQDYGYENVFFVGYFYFLPGDALSLQLVATNNDAAVPITVNGALSWFKESANPIGSFGIYY